MKKISYEKSFSGEVYSTTARVELKTNYQPDNKPKDKVTKQPKNKVTVPTVNDTVDVENIDNLVDRPKNKN